MQGSVGRQGIIGDDIQTGMRNIKTAFSMACTTKMVVIVEEDHLSHGILRAGSPYRKTLSMATHFMNNHNESVSSVTRPK